MAWAEKCHRNMNQMSMIYMVYANVCRVIGQIFLMQTNNGVIQWAGQLAKMTSPGGKLTAPACHLTKKVNKAEVLTYLTTNICLCLQQHLYMSMVLAVVWTSQIKIPDI